MAVDEGQIATVELAPGENVTGTITGKGAFTAKTVTYTDGLIGDSVRADVS
uniref:TRAM domain-containing protein n=1 Tax=Streptomyces sp. NBC_00049 TaxID=2903617 RepID=A0AAU2JIH3_9ACTN